MLGGGFIGQMHQTNKQNREMLKKEKRNPFENKDSHSRGEKEALVDNKRLTNQEQENLINEVKLESKKEDRKSIVILLVSTVITLLILGLLYWMWAEKVVALMD